MATTLILFMVSLCFAQNYSDLSPLEGAMISGQVIDFDVTKDSQGGIVAVYSRKNETGGMTISLAKMDEGKWSHIPVRIPLSSTSTSSITFMEDSEGVYWIAYATRQNLGRTGVDTRMNTSIWLSKSGDGGSTWSSPVLTISYTSLHENNIGIWPHLSLVEDHLGGLWFVWGHAYRRSLDTYKSTSDDRGFTWSRPTLFPKFDGMSPGYYEGFFSDPQGNLHLVYRTHIYLGRGALAQIVSTDCGKTWMKGEPEYLLPRDNSEIRYARLFLEQTLNSPKLWLLWLSYCQVHPEIPRRSLVVEYSSDLGSSWEHYGFFNVSSFQSGDQYVLIPSTDEPDKLWILWLLRDQELLYKSIPDLPFISSTTLLFGAGTLLNRIGRGKPST